MCRSKSLYSPLLLLLDEKHVTISRTEQRKAEKENVDDKLTLFKSITSNKIIAKESTDAKIDWQEAKLCQHNQEQKNMLLIQLQASKNQRLQVIMQVNASISSSPNFGPGHCMYERYVLNLAKIDELLRCNGKS